MSNAEIGESLVTPTRRKRDAVPGARDNARPVLTDAARSTARKLNETPISGPIFTGLLRLGEFSGLAVVGLALAFTVPDPEASFSLYAAASATAGLLAVLFFNGTGAYQIAAVRQHVPTLARMLVAWAAVFAVITTTVFFMQRGLDFSRIWLASFFGAGAVALVVERVVISSLARRWTREGRLERRAVIVGGGQVAADLIAALEAQPDNDVRICGIFDDRKGDRSPGVVAGYQKLGTVAELVEFGRMTKLDMLIVTLPVTAESRLMELLKKLWVLPVDIRLSASANKLKFRPRAYSYIGDVPFIDLADKPLADWDRVSKRLFDLFFGVLALVALSPVMIGAAVAIKLDSRGPVFFRQKRYGFNNDLIDVWKFRSMYVDMADAGAARLVTKGDPRVTPVGRFIRKTSIDELPQLFNVIAGSLSLVGPRPHALSAKADDRLYEQVVDSYFARHRVKPGVTGWAQINGWRGETDTSDKIQKRVECDLYYIENWSPMLDLYILFATPFRLLNTENAY